MEPPRQCDLLSVAGEKLHCLTSNGLTTHTTSDAAYTRDSHANVRSHRIVTSPHCCEITSERGDPNRRRAVSRLNVGEFRRIGDMLFLTGHLHAGETGEC